MDSLLEVTTALAALGFGYIVGFPKHPPILRFLSFVIVLISVVVSVNVIWIKRRERSYPNHIALFLLLVVGVIGFMNLLIYSPDLSNVLGATIGDIGLSFQYPTDTLEPTPTLTPSPSSSGN